MQNRVRVSIPIIEPTIGAKLPTEWTHWMWILLNALWNYSRPGFVQNIQCLKSSTLLINSRSENCMILETIDHQSYNIFIKTSFVLQFCTNTRIYSSNRSRLWPRILKHYTCDSEHKNFLFCTRFKLIPILNNSIEINKRVLGRKYE